jgi:hypothetical protein
MFSSMSDNVAQLRRELAEALRENSELRAGNEPLFGGGLELLLLFK